MATWATISARLRSVVEARFDLNDDRNTFAVLLAPVFLMAFAMAFNVSNQSKWRYSWVVPDLVSATEFAREQNSLREFVPPVASVRAAVVPLTVQHAAKLPVPATSLRRVVGLEPDGLPVAFVRENTVVASTRSADRGVALNASARGVRPPIGERRFVVPALFDGDAVMLARAGENVAGADVLPRDVVHAREADVFAAAVRDELVGVEFMSARLSLGEHGGPLARADSVGVPELRASLFVRARIADVATPAVAGVFLPTIELAPFVTVPMTRKGLIATALAVSVATMHGDLPGPGSKGGVCVASVEGGLLAASGKSSAAKIYSGSESGDGNDQAFGVALARAARSQTENFVIYNDKYMSIRYPMGDVPSLYGVCTDVVVRAFRSLGVDLQELVYRSRIGRGDRSINHRRVTTLKRFFRRAGEKLPISNYAEDYLPGDIVTYHRPQNRGSKTHIGIVADVIAASGRPMLIHNRGWGPQMEDALFVDQITGHFRYRGPKSGPTRTVAASQSPPQSLVRPISARH